MSTRANETAILFTAFEPSGDEHAAVVIAHLLDRHPELTIYAWGGPKMEAAGATVVERTGEDAVMGLPGLAKIREHRRINQRLAAWLRQHPEVGLHVPVDSPAANFPICKITRKLNRRIIHLVAPQVWAWGSWRIRKLRRLTDLVLCVLPFEEPWFTQRGVAARFIGHPLFNHPLSTQRLADQAQGFAGLFETAGQQSPSDASRPHRIALLPGSRPGEYMSNFGLLLESFKELRRRHPHAQGLVAATTPRVVERLKASAAELGEWPEGLAIVHGQTDAVLHWCDVALVVSGTVTLQVARHLKPMVIVYRSNPVLYFALAQWLLASEYLTLPNLIAGREVVPELVPHFGGPEPLIAKAHELLTDAHAAEAQRANLRQIVDRFREKDAGREAALHIERVLGLSAGGERLSEASAPADPQLSA